MSNTRIWGQLFWARWIIATTVALGVVLLVDGTKPLQAQNERVVTIYHDGIEETVVTDAQTVAEALARSQVSLGEHDAVEPARTTQLIAPSYSINIYRARPVVVVDGNARYQITSAHTSARQIAASAGLTLHAEDGYELTRINDFVADGVGLKLTIERSKPLSFIMYGKQVEVRTRAATIADFLAEKQIKVDATDRLWPTATTPIAANMTVALYADGTMDITEEAVPFGVKKIQDADQPLGYKQVQTPGELGKRFVIYHLENGQRRELQSYIMVQPKEQIEVVGTKSTGGGLTKSKGVNYYIDSRGVGHRETYYDLPMSKVMGYCDGTFGVRADGAKVDQAGYIIVAANLSRYPRCSVVETSLGLGKVYDTGGFARVHPDGFDLATDWSNSDGR